MDAVRKTAPIRNFTETVCDHFTYQEIAMQEESSSYSYNPEASENGSSRVSDRTIWSGMTVESDDEDTKDVLTDLIGASQARGIPESEETAPTAEEQDREKPVELTQEFQSAYRTMPPRPGHES